MKEQLKELNLLLSEVGDELWESFYYSKDYPKITKILQRLQKEGMEINFSVVSKPYLVSEVD